MMLPLTALLETLKKKKQKYLVQCFTFAQAKCDMFYIQNAHKVWLYSKAPVLGRTYQLKGEKESLTQGKHLTS